MIEKDQIKLWGDVHTSKKNNNEYVNDEAKKIHEKMKFMKTQIIEENEEPRSDSDIVEVAVGSRPGYVKGMGYGIDASRKRQYKGVVGTSAEIKEHLLELENAKEKIVDLTEAYEEQKKALEEQKKEVEICREQNKIYSHQIDALQTQMAEMQQLLKMISVVNLNSK